MNSSSTQIETDITWLQDNCEMSNSQCDDIINACEELGGISAEYFCEEFVFVPDDSTPDDIERYHSNDYLNIAYFNALWWS